MGMIGNGAIILELECIGLATADEAIEIVLGRPPPASQVFYDLLSVLVMPPDFLPRSRPRYVG